MQIPDFCHGRNCESEVRQVEVIHGYWGIGRAANVGYEIMDWIWIGGVVVVLLFFSGRHACASEWTQVK